MNRWIALLLAAMLLLEGCTQKESVVLQQPEVSQETSSEDAAREETPFEETPEEEATSEETPVQQPEQEDAPLEESPNEEFDSEQAPVVPTPPSNADSGAGFQG